MNPFFMETLMKDLAIALVVLLIGCTAGAAGGWYVTRNHYAPIISKMELDAAKAAQMAAQAVSNAVIDNDELKNKLEAQHAQANDALNTLLDHPAGRVLLPQATTCADHRPPDTAAGSAVPAAAPERPDDTAQAALDEFKRGVEQDAAEWSRALNSCRTVMDWARAQ